MACDTASTDLESPRVRFERLRAAFASGRTRPLAWRRQQLRALRELLRAREDELCDAVWADLRKPRFEVEVCESGAVRGEIDFALANLSRWMKPRRARMPLLVQPGHGRIIPEPLGLVLIIGAWNYPLNLVLAPLVGALAGGNAVVIKPSEIAPATSSTLERLLPEYLDPEAVAVITGGPETVQEMIDERADHVFFTGGGWAARAILERAARQLTPVTLELGFKSPCLVNRDTDLQVAARRIAWGKFLNAGQTCVAPDYVLAHESIADELVERLCESVREFFGSDPQKSPDYGRIVNEGHFQRLLRFLGEGEIVCGGTTDADDRYIAPTVMRGVSWTSQTMQEELFGPILPVLTVSGMDEAIRCVNALPPPPVLYLFSSDRATQDSVIGQTRSGNVCINDVVLQLAIPDFPFGGVGESGMGRYHGRYGFETFTRPRGVFCKSLMLDLPLRYPPYSEAKARWIRRLS